jgi:hypothetical protein
MKKRTPSRIVMVICTALLVATSLACGLLTGEREPAAVAETPASDDEASAPDALDDLEAALAAETVDDRPGVLDYLGPPDAFDIAIVQVEGGTVRKESWRYYQYATRVDFVDGEAVLTMEIEPMPEGTLFAAWYEPLAFEEGMTGAEVASVAASASPAGKEPETLDLSEGGEDLTGGTALVGDQILIGLHEDRLVYVETVALMPGEADKE